jgi:glycosyltransferase involved in cell wall biosynthesis
MKPLLSIVIPTKNRQRYAFSTIKSILSISHKSLELIVHDNSDSNKLEKKLSESIKDSRLVYRYNNSPLSAIHNFDYAMQFVNGEYVCFIGDDDGINPEIMRIIEWANKNDLDAIIPSNPVTYAWPSVKNSGELTIYPFTQKYNKIDVSKNLNFFLNSGAVYYLHYKLPKVYHGIVKKKCLDQVYNKLGYYFGGLSMDIFSSIAISSFYPKKVVSIDYPITIAGTSYESNKTHRTEEAKNTKLSNAPHFNNRGPYKWSNSVPSIYSGTSIWAESGIHALEDLNRFDLISEINRYKMVAEIALDSHQNQKQMLNTFLNPKQNKYKYIKYYFEKNRIRLKRLLAKIFNRLFKIFFGKKTLIINDIDSIELGLKEMNKHINKNYMHINYTLKDKYYE